MRTLIDGVIVDETIESLRSQIETLEAENSELKAEVKRYRIQMNANARAMQKSHLLEQM